MSCAPDLVRVAVGPSAVLAPVPDVSLVPVPGAPAAVPDTVPVPALAPPAVHGRDQELARIDHVLSCGAQAVVVSGEAGIGRTTVWRAAASAARGSGRTVLRTTGFSAEQEMAWVGLGDLLDGIDDDVLAALPDAQHEALAIALLRRPATQPSAPRSVGAAVLALLRHLALAGPVLVAVDDVQWVDAATQSVLAFAARRLAGSPVQLLLALRTTDPTAPTHPAPPPELVTALPDAVRIPLGPLRQVDATATLRPEEAPVPERSWPTILDALTESERRVVDMVTRGSANREIASALHLSVRTVEGHLTAAYRKLGVRTRTQLAVLAVR